MADLKISVDKTCVTSLSQALGLMFSRKKTLLFAFKTPQRPLIHNCFVFFPIDLIFLDKDHNIAEIKSNLKPWHFYRAKALAYHLIETPAGKYSPKLGQQIKIIKK